METHEVSEVMWAYLCSVGYGGSKTNVLALAPRTFPVNRHEVSEVLWAYFSSVGYLVLAPRTFPHMKFLKCCGHICVVFNILVLRPIFGISTTHIPSGSTLRFCSAVGIFV